MTSRATAPRDLIVRIALVLDEDEDYKELSPSVWRRFKVSAHVDLDSLHDKILAPLMGWTRNYHTYVFRRVRSGGGGDDICYIQQDTQAVDLMHAEDHTRGCVTREPESAKLGDLLTEVGDRALYTYDLGDSWRHILTLEEVVTASEGAHGGITVLGGAMRCPDEDGDGCSNYQDSVLDLVLSCQDDPFDDASARELADTCFTERHNAINVSGPFRPLDFDLEERKAAVIDALRSRSSSRNSVKMFTSGGGMFGFSPFKMARPGQRVVTTKHEDDRGGEGFYISATETINIKPDDKEKSLCCRCGNPVDLKSCSGCRAVFYCSRECQAEEWHSYHKKQCKLEKRNMAKYEAEKQSGRVASSDIDVRGETRNLEKYQPDNLRFSMGDRVECLMGEDTFGTGKIVRTMYREEHWPASKQCAPYQIKLDLATARRAGVPHERALIYAVWDDDHQIRRLPPSCARGGNGGRHGKKTVSTKYAHMEIVD